ncbi:MAG: polyprenyl synthetase family protein [Armatimonadota bacterium]
MLLQVRMEQLKALVDGWLDELLPDVSQSPQRLHEAMRYSALAPGKRLRPIMMILTAEMLGAEATAVKHTACAIECIHAFSLIHDDLPAIDDDKLRRGRATCHVQFDEPTAILAGDALFALAFDLLSAQDAAVDTASQLAIIREVSKAVGTQGLVGGEMLDIESENQAITADTLQLIHRRKTGMLLECSVVCGAILAGGDPSEIAAIREYGSQIGIAFQVADDLLNVIGDPVLLGKATGTDEQLGKATYPGLYGIDETKQILHQRVCQAKRAIISFGEAAAPLLALANFVEEREQ